MKKIIILLLLILCFQLCDIAVANTSAEDSFQTVQIFSEKNKFGLKDKNENIIAKAKYNKIILLGEHSYIVQKGTHFGIMNKNGEFVVSPKYRHADRFSRKFAKLGNNNDYGLYDEYGEIVLPPEYSSIEPLYGGMFLICKNHKYGLTDNEGKTLIPNDFDRIYMPDAKTLMIKSGGRWYEITELSPNDIVLPEGSKKITINNKELKLTSLVVNTGVYSGYSVVTATDYILKIISSISPAYEETIDELMYSQGADAVSIIMSSRWIILFPGTYIKKYYNNLIAPNSGPLAGVKSDLKNQIK